MYKHITLNERIDLENLLNAGNSLSYIAKLMGRTTSTISREVRTRSTFIKKGCVGKPFNDCTKRKECDLRMLCEKEDCHHSFCNNCRLCVYVCKKYEKDLCPKLYQAPYCCNACKDIHKCTLEKAFYKGKIANQNYKQTLSESRNGVNLTENELLRINELVIPLVAKGHSFHSIYATYKDDLPVDERSFYRYAELGVLNVKSIDMPRKVRRKQRKKAKFLKVDKKCRISRTYQDYKKFIQENPLLQTVEMDSVEGLKTDSKVLLSLCIPSCNLILLFLRERNTAASVKEIFNMLYEKLGHNDFTTLFPVILTDNGSEFSDPKSIEFTANSVKRTHIFYCDPSRPDQKSHVENIHTMIRRIIPKGQSFENLTQESVKRMENHINSYVRKHLGDNSPIRVFELFFGKELSKKLNLKLIPSHEITLKPDLLK